MGSKLSSFTFVTLVPGSLRSVNSFHHNNLKANYLIKHLISFIYISFFLFETQLYGCTFFSTIIALNSKRYIFCFNTVQVLYIICLDLSRINLQQRETK